MRIGLIDEIGGIARAAKLALELTGDMAEPEIVMPKKRANIKDRIRRIYSKILTAFKKKKGKKEKEQGKSWTSPETRFF